MKMPTIFQGNWLLVKALYFPMRWVRWVLAIAIALMCIGDLILWKFGQPAALIAGSALAFGYLFYVALSLPGQMLVLASSKQFSFLEKLRQKLGVLLFVCCCICAFFIALYGFFSDNKSNFSNVFFAALCVISILFIGSIFVTKHIPIAQVLIFFLGVAFIKIAVWLAHSNPLISIAGVVIVWAVFMRWWLLWKPSRFHRNYVNLTQSDFVDLQNSSIFNQRWITKALHIKPKTLVGSVLLGGADGWVTHVKRCAAAIAFFMIVIAGCAHFFGAAIFQNLFHRMGNFYLYVLCVAPCFGFITIIFRNMHKLWMYFPGARAALFWQLEKFYYSLFVVAITPFIVIYLMVNIVYGQQIFDAIYFGFIALFSVLVIATLLYISLIAYVKTRASMAWSSGLGAGLIVLSFPLVFASNLVWEEQKDHIIFYSLVAFGLMSAVVCLLRYWAIKLWPYVDFMRVKI